MVTRKASSTEIAKAPKNLRLKKKEEKRHLKTKEKQVVNRP